MKFTTALATMAAVVSAQQDNRLPEIEARTHGQYTTKFTDSKTDINLCGDSKFNWHTNFKDPTVDDCVTLAQNMAHSPGFWTITWDGHYDPSTSGGTILTSIGTCKFVMYFGDAITRPALQSFYFGSKDIADIINDAVARSYQGHIGADGALDCHKGGVDSPMKWALKATS